MANRHTSSHAFCERGLEDPAVLIFSSSFSGCERPPAYPKYQVRKLLGRLLWVETSGKTGGSNSGQLWAWWVLCSSVVCIMLSQAFNLVLYLLACDY